MLKVCKFGGTSMASSKMFMKVKDIVLSDDLRKVVVCSAAGKRDNNDSKITDLLYILHAHLKYNVPYEDIWNNIKNRFIEIRNDLNIDLEIEKELDLIHSKLNKNMKEEYLISRGEYLTSMLFAKYIGFEFVDATKLFIFSFDGALAEKKTEENIKNALNNYKNIVVPGFYGAYVNDDIRLFSRGGSDISGAYLARYLNASVYENWTDVSGILAADPKIVSNPKIIQEITYQELRELSYMGANVLHEETIFPVMQMNIPINLKNTNKPEDSGTIIKNNIDNPKDFILGLAGKNNFMTFNIFKSHMSNEIGFLRKTLSIFEKYNVSVEHIPSGIDSFSVVVLKDNAFKFQYEIISEIKNELGAEVVVDDDLALISIVGRNIKGKLGYSGEIFKSLGNEKINVKLIALGPLELSLIVGVNKDNYLNAIKTLYNGLIK